MNRTLLSLTVLGLFCSGSFVQAQDDGTQRNEDYEQLKVLEPLIGTFAAKWQADDGEREAHVTRAWADSKRMVIQTVKIGAAGSELREMPGRTFFAWNRAEERIERISVNPNRGVFEIHKVNPKGDGEFVLTRLSINRDTKRSQDITIIASADAVTQKSTNRINSQGEPEDDRTRTLRRIKAKDAE